MGSIALLLVIIVAAVIVTACLLQSQNQPASGMISRQNDLTRQILINDKFINNFSGVGESELFDTGYNISRTLVILPVTIEGGQYVKKAFIVDLEQNRTLAEIHCYGNNLSMDRLKSIVNLTANAPVVKDDFWDNKTTLITFDVDGFEDTAPEYDNWMGKFISMSVTVNKQGWGIVNHKISVTIDDTKFRVITVSDYYNGAEYQYSPVYVLLPPGKEKYLQLSDYPSATINSSFPYQWWTRVTLVPQDAKVYPLIFEESNYWTIRNNSATNALVYMDFMTGDIQRYDGDNAVSSGWSANISLNHHAWIHLALKSAETDRDIQAEVEIIPDEEIIKTLQKPD